MGLQNLLFMCHLLPRGRATWCGNEMGFKRSRVRIAGPPTSKLSTKEAQGFALWALSFRLDDHLVIADPGRYLSSFRCITIRPCLRYFRLMPDTFQSLPSLVSAISTGPVLPSV